MRDSDVNRLDISLTSGKLILETVNTKTQKIHIVQVYGGGGRNGIYQLSEREKEDFIKS